MATLSAHNVDLPFHEMRSVLEIIAVEGLVAVTKALLSMTIRSMPGLEPKEELMGNRVEESLLSSSLLKGFNDACRPSEEEIIDGSDSRVVPIKKNVISSEVGECKDAGSDDEDEDEDDEDDEDQDEIGDEEDDLSAEEGGEDQNGEDEEGKEGGEAAANGNDEDDDEDDEDGEEDEDDDEDEEDEEDEDEEDEEPPAKKKK